MSVSKLRFGVTCALSVALLAGSASAGFFSRDRLNPAEARDILVALAETGAPPPSIDRVRELVEAYRTEATPGFLPLSSAAYPRFLLNAKLGDIYPALYRTTVKDLLGDIPEGMPLEDLFDGLMHLVAEKRVPENLKKDLSKLSPRMAKRALQGKGPKCPLDGSDKISEPGLLKLLSLKIDVFNWGGPCKYRTRLYNAAKKSLIEAREKFPDEYRKGFLAKINETVSGFPKLVGHKFGAGDVVHPIWNASVLENDPENRVSGGRRIVTLKLFAEGLLADLYAARALVASDRPSDRSLAAGLFYAVVGRWLLITGGTAADWDPKTATMPIARMGKGMEVPKFREARFGGWGVEIQGFAPVATPWDWGAYDPTADEKPSALRIFPSRIEIDANGVAYANEADPLVQSNGDFALLLAAVSEFLKATQPGTPFARHFGGEDQVGDLLDLQKPMLFPTEGRMIAVGVLAAVAKNLLHPEIGHVGRKSTGLTLLFRDGGTLPGLGEIRASDIDMPSVSRLLVAAAGLMRTLEVDPILTQEEKLKLILPEVRTLVHVGSLIIGKETQATNGSFRTKIASGDMSRGVDAQLAALRVLLTAYNDATAGVATTDSKSFTAPRIVPGLQYLFANDLAAGVALTERQKLEARAMWNECQASLRAARPDLPWKDWEARIRSL